MNTEESLSLNGNLSNINKRFKLKMSSGQKYGLGLGQLPSRMKNTLKE